MLDGQTAGAGMLVNQSTGQMCWSVNQLGQICWTVKQLGYVGRYVGLSNSCLGSAYLPLQHTCLPTTAI